MSLRCNDLLSPGEVYEHWCELEADHAGDHRCGDCADVWNPSRYDDDLGWPESHEKWEGSCAECLEMREAFGRL